MTDLSQELEEPTNSTKDVVDTETPICTPHQFPDATKMMVIVEQKEKNSD